MVQNTRYAKKIQSSEYFKLEAKKEHNSPTNPTRANSTTRKNPTIWDSPLYIALMYVPIVQLLNRLLLQCL